MFTEADHRWMQHAILLAKYAERQGEVPVGAVLVANDEIVGEGFNQSIQSCDPTAHAEVVALRKGALALQNYRVVDSTLYVTLEPCIMCVGALVQGRIKRLVYGAHDPRAGAINSAFQILEANKLNHRFECDGGLLAEECGKMLTEFFRSRR